MSCEIQSIVPSIFVNLAEKILNAVDPLIKKTMEVCKWVFDNLHKIRAGICYGVAAILTFVVLNPTSGYYLSLPLAILGTLFFAIGAGTFKVRLCKIQIHIPKATPPVV